MKTGPDIALLGSLIGDPARANMLTALMGGKALTATELAQEAGITPQTASSHLAKLESGGLLTPEKQGRHRYFRISGEEVADALEALMGLAAYAGHNRVRTGPKDPAMRQARVCYDHLAGDRGVQMFDHLTRRGLISFDDALLALTTKGRRFAEDFGIDLTTIGASRRPLCKACLDWSVRRNHLAGAFGAALLNRFYDLKWARREKDSRVVSFSRRGSDKFDEMFGSPRR
ncbi:winged helix-turn-helix domain-containing protein [Bradyrhizobium prioriisuperbiae]|uniref:ArsR/SmtB family transcription factor n=1 Tax=Bradyrhizobium prioriisuperbiae TaxID=2854389 RepID=UPI0028E1ABDF|nr:winged helix-turn-helix domain-containing protein [Bradyrhizobium prioritasuperba]